MLDEIIFLTTDIFKLSYKGLARLFRSKHVYKRKKYSILYALFISPRGRNIMSNGSTFFLFENRSENTTQI